MARSFFVPAPGRELPTSDDLYQQRFDLLYYVDGLTEDALNRMPIYKIRKYYDLLVKKKKEENEAREAARTGKAPGERQRLRPPMSDQEAHGADPGLGDHPGPRYVRDRIRREPELAAQRQANIDALQQRKDAIDRTMAEARKTGRPLVIRGGRVMPLGHDPGAEKKDG